MWILTQNGERILSTEALDEIRVADPAPGKTDYAIMMNRRSDGKGFALGFYHNKQYALGILKAIINTQATWFGHEGWKDPVSGVVRPTVAFVPPKTYRMPPDEKL